MYRLRTLHSNALQYRHHSNGILIDTSSAAAACIIPASVCIATPAPVSSLRLPRIWRVRRIHANHTGFRSYPITDSAISSAQRSINNITASHAGLISRSFHSSISPSASPIWPPPSLMVRPPPSHGGGTAGIRSILQLEIQLIEEEEKINRLEAVRQANEISASTRQLIHSLRRIVNEYLFIAFPTERGGEPTHSSVADSRDLFGPVARVLLRCKTRMAELEIQSERILRSGTITNNKHDTNDPNDDSSLQSHQLSSSSLHPLDQEMNALSVAYFDAFQQITNEFIQWRQLRVRHSQHSLR
jgi:hypothetical protein